MRNRVKESGEIVTKHTFLTKCLPGAILRHGCLMTHLLSAQIYSFPLIDNKIADELSKGQLTSVSVTKRILSVFLFQSFPH